MTLQELRQAVTEATTPTEELITAVLDFADDFDPYGFRDYYGTPGTPEFNEAVSEAFNTHELIKLSVLKNCPDDPKELGITIAERTKSELVMVIGKKFVLYKPFKDNPVIVLPKAGKNE